ncbi:FAD-dependent oxidoreductase [Hymenobacter sp. BT186]|uniref:FAD-dependent oxidoreductase n=1 Tax=Hymenobacter telluris TaxID=2816474 RepID=A0A939JEE4_9BACT|nr:NAD(P)/FAD-dependent oxidoreductase [Hymenobacter telluris]MBO0360355.1 FAD-dependent oxidoreductase [Hymenobacter telluris]MBW3376382.1 FAD-dependent oxidoreductase [Hymenobacter norwichensis]
MNVPASAQLPVVIIGAGMAGLTCANYLHRAGVPVVVLEATEAVGGRVRTDVTADGFRLDHGFQVLLTKYPEVQRMMDYGALDLKAFRSGAVIRLPDGRETTLQNPLQNPLAAFPALTSPIGTLADKLRILSLVQHVRNHSSEELLAHPATDTLTFLRRYGWSEQIIDTFFRPFFGGVFLDRSLTTASNFFEFVFQQFVEGEAAVPALGIQQIPEQLAKRLPAGSVRLNSPVETVEGTTVRLRGGETLAAAAVVVATDGDTTARLLPHLPQLHATAWRRTTCTYFAAPASPGRQDKLLRLNAAPGQMAHNVCFPSDVAPEYAPPGQTLVSVSTHGEHHLPETTLVAMLHAELMLWFGDEVAQWKHLRTYHIPHALPVYANGPAQHQELQLSSTLYRCGDYTAYPSLNAAMASGRQVAERILGS